MTITDDVQPGRLLIDAIFVTMAGGLVVAIGGVMDMPVWLVLVGLAAFLVGCAAAGVLCFRASRREGVDPVAMALGVSAMSTRTDVPIAGASSQREHVA